MATFLDVINHRGLSKPHIPVKMSRRGGFFKGATSRRTSNVASYFFDFSYPSFSDYGDGSEKSICTSVLRAYLKDSPGFFRHLANLLSFFNGKSERFFTVNVLPCLHRLNGDASVPVIRCSNGNKVNVFSIDDLPIILVALCLALCKRLVDPIDPLGIEIANRN